MICYLQYLFEILVPSNLKPIAVRILPNLACTQRTEKIALKFFLYCLKEILV